MESLFVFCTAESRSAGRVNGVVVTDVTLPASFVATPVTTFNDPSCVRLTCDAVVFVTARGIISIRSYCVPL